MIPRKPGNDYSTHRLLIGTHTSGADQNYLQIANVQLPISSVELENYDDDRGGTAPIVLLVIVVEVDT